MMKIRVLLADDHRMFREALRLQLIGDHSIEIVAEAGSGTATLQAVAETTPDVVVLDIALPDGNGIETARDILARHPHTRIVALSGYSERMYVEEMLRAGARAYVVKSAGADELLRAIHAVHAGQVFLSPEVASSLIEQPPSGTPPATVLSRREREVLRLLASGLRSAEIAGELGISVATVEVHRRNLKQKLRLRTVAELTRYAIRAGLQAA